MDFGKAFTYPFDDPDWLKKILIPALIAIIPIVGQIFLIGWSLDVTRRIIRREPSPLPELDFGRQMVDGLKAFVIGLVYAIPVFILIIPVIIVSVAASSGNTSDNSSNGLVAAVTLCCSGLIFIYSLVLAFVLPAVYANFIANENLGAAFRFQEVIGLVRAAPGAYLIVLLGVIITSFIAQLGTIACGIGVLATLTYSMAVNGHLYGQAYNEATRNTGFAKVY